MNSKPKEINENWKDNEAQSSSDEVFHHCHQGYSQIAKHAPEVSNRRKTCPQYDEQSNPLATKVENHY
jgi:hypothetical protein